jgi:hypothetical protein
MPRQFRNNTSPRRKPHNNTRQCNHRPTSLLKRHTLLLKHPTDRQSNKVVARKKIATRVADTTFRKA